MLLRENVHPPLVFSLKSPYLVLKAFISSSKHFYSLSSGAIFPFNSIADTMNQLRICPCELDICEEGVVAWIVIRSRTHLTEM